MKKKAIEIVKVMPSGKYRVLHNTRQLFEAVQMQLIQHLNRQYKNRSDIMLQSTYTLMQEWYLKQNWLANKEGRFILKRSEAFALVVLLIPYNTPSLIELKAALLKAL